MSQDAFLYAWKSAIALTSFQCFGAGTAAACAAATDKNQLRPDWDRLLPAFERMSSGERVLLAHMLTFYNSAQAAWPYQKLVLQLRSPTLGEAASVLDSDRRQALARLILTYNGW